MADRRVYPIADWRLQIADSRIADCRLTIWIGDCRLPIDDLDWRLPIALAIADWIGDCRLHWRLPIALAIADWIGDCRLDWRLLMSLSEILCVGHNMRSIDAPQTKAPKSAAPVARVPPRFSINLCAKGR